MAKSLGPEYVGVVTPFAILSLIVLCLRFYTRLRITRNPGLEDLFIGLSWVFATTLHGLLIKLVIKNGLGKHIWNLKGSEADLIPFQKIFFAGIFLYNFSLGSAKLSMFLQYLRLFPTGYTRLASQIGVVIVSANIVWGFFINLFFCVPVDKFWHMEKEGRCLTARHVWFAFAGANIATSCIIILLPIPVIVTLKMATRTKIALCCVFGLGVFDIILAALRLSSLGYLATTIDATYYLSKVGTWSLLEAYVAIICASAPVLRPLITKYVPRFFSTGHSYASQDRRTPGSKTASRNLSGHRLSKRISALIGGEKAKVPAGGAGDVEADGCAEDDNSTQGLNLKKVPSEELMVNSAGKIVVKSEIQQTWDFQPLPKGGRGHDVLDYGFNK